MFIAIARELLHVLVRIWHQATPAPSDHLETMICRIALITPRLTMLGTAPLNCRSQLLVLFLRNEYEGSTHNAALDQNRCLIVIGNGVLDMAASDSTSKERICKCGGRLELEEPA